MEEHAFLVQTDILMILRRLALASCLTAAIPFQAAAEGKLAYVIGNTRFGGTALESPAKDAVSISRALLSLGFDVIRRQNVTATDFPIGARSADTVALYYSGRTAVGEDGDIVLRGAQLGDTETAGWPVLATARALRASGAQNVLVFVETCQTDDDGLAALPDDASQLDGVFLAVSHDPSIGCPAPAPDDARDVETAEGTADATTPETTLETSTSESEQSTEQVEVAEPEPRFTERVRLALATPDMPLAEAMNAAAGGGWLSDSLTAPVFLWPQQDAESDPAGGQLPAGALEMLANLPADEQARMREVWQNAGLMDADGNVIDRSQQSRPVTTIIVAPEASSSGVTIVAPVTTAVSPVIPQNAPGGTRVASGRVAPVQPTAQRPPGGSSGQSASAGGATNAVQIFTPVPRQAAPAALPTAAGLPEPYLIFGEIRPTNASFDPTETGEVQGSALDTSSFETRNQIRNDSPDLYADLVAGGAFDPEDGSSRGLARAIQTELARMNCYTSTIDGIWGNGSRRSVTAYFDQISEAATGLEPTLDLYRKVILNDDVSCPVVRQAATPQRSTGGTTTQRNTAPAQQPARQAPASTGGGLNTNNLGSGIFR